VELKAAARARAWPRTKVYALAERGESAASAMRQCGKRLERAAERAVLEAIR
jgi:hypothetical protein